MIESLISQIISKAEKVFDIPNDESEELLSVCILPVTTDPAYFTSPAYFQAFLVYTSPENRNLNIGKYLNYPQWSKRCEESFSEDTELYSEAKTVEEALQDLLKSLIDLESQKELLKPKQGHVWIIKDLKGKYYNCFRWEESQKNATRFPTLANAKNIANSIPNPVKIVKLKKCEV